jgi:hypothetical protein
MKVFISWSGELSRKVAEALNDWLPQVIQSIKTFYSPDIQKGKRWQERISTELKECKFGIICLTANNLHEDWILFEAGAISKIVSESNVATLLINLNQSDVTEPLSIFQSTNINKIDVFKLLTSINSEIKTDPLPIETLKKIFEKWWTDLEEKIQKALTSKDVQKTERPKRTDGEKLEELIGISRALGSDFSMLREEIIQLEQKKYLPLENVHRRTIDNDILQDLIKNNIELFYFDANNLQYKKIKMMPTGKIENAPKTFPKSNKAKDK